RHGERGCAHRRGGRDRARHRPAPALVGDAQPHDGRSGALPRRRRLDGPQRVAALLRRRNNAYILPPACACLPPSAHLQTMNHAPAADAAARERGRRHAGLRLAFPLIALTLLVGGVGAFGYRSLSEEIRRETQRTLAVIAEQKRQHIEGWLAEARVDAQMVFSGHSQLETV